MEVLLGSTQIRVHLAADTLIACEIRSSWRGKQVTRKESFDFEPGEREMAMDKLSAWIKKGPSRRSIVWIIGPAQAEYFVLPWSPALIDQGMRDAYARALFEELYERDASTAAFGFGAASHGSSQLVSWVSAELPVELAAHARRSGCELAGIKPAIATVWDRFRDVLETEAGTLCIVDGDRQAIVRHNRKRIEDIVIRPFGNAPSMPSKLTGVFRRFSNEASRSPVDTSPADLNLPARNGFASTQDGTYAFALCGAL